MKKYINILILFFAFQLVSKAQSFWVQKANCTFGAFIPGFYFSYGDKIYVAKPNPSGTDSIIYYNQTTNTWHYYGQFPGVAKLAAATTAGNKAFVFCGTTCTGLTTSACLTKQVWQLDLITNTWTQLPNFPGSARHAHQAVFNKTNGNIYIPFGQVSASPPTPTTQLVASTDFWEFNPVTLQYTQKSSFSSNMSGRFYHSCYTEGNFVYAAWGASDSPNTFTFGNTAIYDITTNTWSAPFSVGTLRRLACAFNVGGNVYGGMGNNFIAGTSTQHTDFFNILPGSLPAPTFPGIPCSSALSIDCGGRGYIGLGISSANGTAPVTSTALTQLWEFYPGFNVTNDFVNTSVNTTTTINPLLNDGGYALTSLSVAIGPQNGTFGLNSSLGLITYTPNLNFFGLDSIRYTVCSSVNSLSCASAWIKINVLSPLQISPNNPVICGGASVTLNASGFSTYTWSPGNFTTPSIVVSPSVSTIYTVIGQSTLGIASKTVLVNAYSASNVTVTQGTPVFCVGQPGPLGAILTASGATTYSWNSPTVQSSSTTVVNTTSAGTSTYNLYATVNGCFITKSIAVTVNPKPNISVAASPTAICLNQSVALIAGGASTYTWTTLANITGSNVSFTPTTSTITHSVTGISSIGCTGTGSIQIIAGAVPIMSVIPTSNSICSGSSVTLSGSGASTYTWLPSNVTTSTLVVTPTITTVYTLQGSNASCPSFTSVAITVTTSPALNINASSTALCFGASATLTANGASNYTWQPSNATTASVIVNPTVSTTYSLTGTNGGCSSFTSVAITVTNSPALNVNVSSTTLCSGGNATLTANGASNYTWQPSNATTNSIIVSPSVSTIYSLTGVNGACSSFTTIAITVTNSINTSINASANALCAGASATLTANGANTYTWLPSNATSNFIVVSPSVTSTYSVIGLSGSCQSQNAITVSVTPYPTLTVSATPSLITSGSSVTLSCLGSNSTSWFPGNLSGTSVVVNPTISTTYTVYGTNPPGCTNASLVSVLVNVGLNEIDNLAAEFTIYPTITASQLFIQTLSANEYRIRITNTIGQEVLNQTNTGNTILNIESFSNGLYYCTIYTATQTQLVKKIIKN